MKPISKEHKYEGRVLAVSYGKGEEAYVEAKVDEYEVEKILRGLPLAAKINLEKNAPVVAMVAEIHRLNPRDYIKSDDIAILILDKGYKTREELQKADPGLWGVVQEMHLETTLEKRVFSAYQ